MITHIHHLNILVEQLGKSVEYWSAMLNQQPIIEPLAGRGVVTARFKIGETFLVLVSPEDDASVLWPLLQEQGEGLFLLSLGTDDLANAIQDLQQSDICSPASDLRKGLANWSVRDITAPSMGNSILQLCQEKSAQ